jgi:hypothetical protein
MTRFKLDARWAIVVVGFVALSLAFSGRNLLSLTMASWVEEFGWSKASISSVMTAALVIMAKGRALSSPAASSWSAPVRRCWLACTAWWR